MWRHDSRQESATPAGLTRGGWWARPATAIALAAVLGLVAACGAASGSDGQRHDQAAVGGPKVDTAGTVPRIGPSLTPEQKALLAPAPPPARLVIPSLKVDAVVEAVGVDAEGRVAPPSRAEAVGWYKLGAAPGDPGDAVIDGHLDWTNGPAVFWRLGSLRPGDQVTIVRQDGSQAQFVVDTTATYPFDSSPPGLFSRSGPPSISLVTCSGSWDRQRQTYLERLIVHATLAPTKPVTPPGDEGG